MSFCFLASCDVSYIYNIYIYINIIYLYVLYNDMAHRNRSVLERTPLGRVGDPSEVSAQPNDITTDNLSTTNNNAF